MIEKSVISHHSNKKALITQKNKNNSNTLNITTKILIVLVDNGSHFETLNNYTEGTAFFQFSHSKESVLKRRN
jgi:hypothetical protein